MPKGYISIKEYQKNTRFIQENAAAEWKSEVDRLQRQLDTTKSQLQSRINDEKDAANIVVANMKLKDQIGMLKNDISELQLNNLMLNAVIGKYRSSIKFIHKYGWDRFQEFFWFPNPDEDQLVFKSED